MAVPASLFNAFTNFPFNPGDNFNSIDQWNFEIDKCSVVADGSTSADGTNKWFQTLTNSGTATMTSTQAGYEGMPVSTTGSGSGNQNAYIATQGFKAASGRQALMYGKFFFADPNVHAYSFWFGLGNKQVDPNGTIFTDGLWIQGKTASGAIAFTGNSVQASGAIATTSTLGTIASGVPRSVEMAVAISQGLCVFVTHDPTLATNPWVILQTATLPASTVTLRPHFVHYTNAAFTNAVQIGSIVYAYNKLPTY